MDEPPKYSLLRKAFLPPGSCGLLPVLIFLAGLFAFPARAAEEKEGAANLQKRFRKAFKPLKVPSPRHLEKAILPVLPQGVVIEPGPFETVARNLLGNFSARFSLREEVMKALSDHPSSTTGRSVRDGLKVVTKENGDFARRKGLVEKEYSGAYDKGYMDAGEKERRTRKLSAVLIPFYTGLMARNDKVLGLAVDAMASMKKGEGLDWLSGSALKDTSPTVRSAAAQALGRIPCPKAVTALGQAVKSDKESRVRWEALNALMSWPLKEVSGAVEEALRDSSWEVRALAVMICARGNLVGAAGLLISALEEEEGRLRKDMDDALFQLLGVRYYGDGELWRKWYEGNREKVEKKARALEAKGEYDKPLGRIDSGKGLPRSSAGKEDEKKATTSFYGIQTFSKKLIYIVDISRSMMSPAGAAVPGVSGGGGSGAFAKPEGNSKIDIAKWQLHRAVHALPKDAVFNIIVYSESYRVWCEGMMKAGARSKGEAHKFIDGLPPNGTTNIYDSLMKAFEIAGAGPPGAVKTGKRKELAADTIFLLSDGKPNRGRLTDAARIVSDIRSRNPGIVIHTIGIGEAAGSELLKKLAEENGGHYVGFK